MSKIRIKKLDEWVFLIASALVTAMSFKIATICDQRIGSLLFDIFGALNCVIIFLVGKFIGAYKNKD